MMRKVLYKLITILMLLTFTGCSVSNILPEVQDESLQPVENEEDLSDQSQVPTKGGQLRVAVALPDNIHPLFTKSKDFINLSGLIYEGLFTYDENFNLRPVLAESWEVLDEGKIWQIELKKGVKWHDGTELTAQDVKYTFDLLFNNMQSMGEEDAPNSSIYARRLFEGRNIARMEYVVNNPYAVTIILNEPAGRTFMEALTFPILPAREDQESHNVKDINFLVGTGPYRVESGNLEAGGEIKLVRNHAWWNSEEPYIDSIIAKIYRDNEEALEAFREGQVDLVDTHVVYADFYRMSRQGQIFRYLTHYFVYIGINHKSPGVLGDSKVRQAIAYALDRKDIVSRVYASCAQSVDVPIPPDSWYYDSDLRVYDYQPQKALQLLEEAGWKNFNDDGILCNNNGEPLSFTINVNTENIMHKEALNIIVDQLREVGIDANLRLQSWEDYVLALEEGDFEAVLSERYLDIFTDLRIMFHSSQIGNGLNNYIAYSNSKLDELLDKIPVIQDTQEFKDTYKKIQQHLIEELPIISLYYRTSSLLAGPNVHGIKLPRDLMIFRDANKWYLSP